MHRDEVDLQACAGDAETQQALVAEVRRDDTGNPEYDQATQRRVNIRHLRKAAGLLEQAEANVGCCLGLEPIMRALLCQLLAAVGAVLVDVQAWSGTEEKR